ncbi:MULTISPECIES: hypothetical protein [unclassified Nostoc]|uniref:hypothetical protein n=1 Tax=unclassified Nostoc TaxID=2593658 RepID=UPI001DEE0B6F|nr:hypothetical protein [Nostoc sp. JL34]MBN3883804.1 hypothetical protein [Nostoc sp. JL34]
MLKFSPPASPTIGVTPFICQQDYLSSRTELITQRHCGSDRGSVSKRLFEKL